MAANIPDVTVENTMLRNQLDLNLLDPQQLIESNIVHRQALFRIQYQLAQTKARAKCLENLAPIVLPNRAFTIQELERANPTMDPEDVRMRLASEISLRHVEYFRGPCSKLDSEAPKFFMYRIPSHPAASAS